MHAVLEQIQSIGIVPVIAINDVEKAVPLARALAAGGLPCAEITFRTAEGEESIRRIAQEVPEVLVGAGTVLTTEQVDRALAAGAQFIVSPGLNPRVVAHCLEKGVPVTPGCSSPSDIEQALELGLEVVKFFPAEPSGGLGYIKSIAAPYRTVRFMPTGGIGEHNLADYLAYERILACGGSWMVRSDLIAAGDFAEITRLCERAMRTAMGFGLAHVGVNCAGADEAMQAAQAFAALFSFAVKPGSSSVFAGSAVEAMSGPGYGTHGHIAISTLNIARAVAYLERKGVPFNPASAKKGKNGELAAIYLRDEVAGFAVHLVQK